MPKKFKIKKKPSKPKRKTRIEVHKTLDNYGTTGADIMLLLQEALHHGVSLTDVEFCTEENWSTADGVLTYRRDESDDEFQARLDKYHVAKEKWDLWTEEHSEEIAAELERQRTEAALENSAEIKKARKRIEELEKEQEKLQRGELVP